MVNFKMKQIDMCGDMNELTCWVILKKFLGEWEGLHSCKGILDGMGKDFMRTSVDGTWTRNQDGKGNSWTKSVPRTLHIN